MHACLWSLLLNKHYADTVILPVKCTFEKIVAFQSCWGVSDLPNLLCIVVNVFVEVSCCGFNVIELMLLIFFFSFVTRYLIIALTSHHHSLYSVVLCWEWMIVSCDLFFYLNRGGFRHRPNRSPHKKRAPTIAHFFHFLQHGNKPEILK